MLDPSHQQWSLYIYIYIYTLRGEAVQQCLMWSLCALAVDRVKMLGSSFNNRIRGSEDKREAKGSHSFRSTVADIICQNFK